MGIDVWSFYYEHCENRRDLSQVERAVLAVCDLRQEVGSGGFDSYLRYWGGNTALEALSILDDALGAAWSEVLRAAIAVLGVSEYPTDVDTREKLLDYDECYDRLDALDDRFYALEGSIDADARLGEFLAQHAPEPRRGILAQLRRR